MQAHGTTCTTWIICLHFFLSKLPTLDRRVNLCGLQLLFPAYRRCRIGRQTCIMVVQCKQDTEIVVSYVQLTIDKNTQYDKNTIQLCCLSFGRRGGSLATKPQCGIVAAKDRPLRLAGHTSQHIRDGQSETGSCVRIARGASALLTRTRSLSLSLPLSMCLFSSRSDPLI